MCQVSTRAYSWMRTGEGDETLVPDEREGDTALTLTTARP